jgi:hypothetical protein
LNAPVMFAKFLITSPLTLQRPTRVAGVPVTALLG